ncbi:MAG: hypothetical protein WHV26_03560 [Spirochaetota bacterium]|jgi:hypothetical protein
MKIFLIILAIFLFIGGMSDPGSFKWHKNPSRLKVVLDVFIILFIAFLFGGSDKIEFKNDELLKKIKPYDIIQKEDISFPGRKRFKIFIIAPEAKTFEQRGLTALKAAMDFCYENDLDFVSAHLEINDRIKNLGYQIAIADFSPDKGGVSGNEKLEKPWGIEAYDGDIDDIKLKATILYETNKKRFLNQNGLVDSNRIRKFINDELKVNDYSLLWIQRKKLEIDSI